MAKVKNQVYDGSEVTYIDAAGDTHFFGELFRHIMPDAYPLPSLNPTGVAKKSSRGFKPPSQGDGSAAQKPWRDCYKACVKRWNEMQDNCPALAPCPAVGSKKNVWDAKQAQGVMCSYFDLYMGCCLSHCSKITVTGPGGVAFTGGTIPTAEPCWPCPPPCLDSDLSIGYTTTRMHVGESQALWAHDSLFGDGVPCCPTGDLSWEIIEGSGTLEPDSGQATVYTAPDINVGCKENPTIQLTDCCGRIATLTLAVNAYVNTIPPHTAVFIGECVSSHSETPDVGCNNNTCPGYPNCTQYTLLVSRLARLYAYFCDGTAVGPGVSCGDKDCGSCGASTGAACYPIPLDYPCTCEEAFGQMAGKCNPASPNDDCPACGADGCSIDVRTAEMIEQGCCPPEIL